MDNTRTVEQEIDAKIQEFKDAGVAYDSDDVAMQIQGKFKFKDEFTGDPDSFYDDVLPIIDELDELDPDGNIITTKPML